MFHLNDSDKLEADFKEAGFSSVKSFYTASNMNSTSSDALWDYWKAAPTFPMMIKDHEDKLEKIEEAFKNLFEEKFGHATNQVLSFEVFVIICQK